METQEHNTEANGGLKAPDMERGGQPELPNDSDTTRDYMRSGKPELTEKSPYEAGRFHAQPPQQGEHSPLPWEIGEDGDVFSDNTDCVAKIVGAPEGVPQGKANAKLIVASVNHVDALAEALRFTVAQLNDLHPEGNKWRGLAFPAIAQGRDALAAWQEAQK